MLEDESQKILTQSSKLTTEQIKHRISVMSLKASRIGCPNPEITRIRKQAAKQIDAKALSSITGNYHGTTEQPGEKDSYDYKFKLSGTVWRRRDDFKAVKSKHRP